MTLKTTRPASAQQKQQPAAQQLNQGNKQAASRTLSDDSYKYLMKMAGIVQQAENPESFLRGRTNFQAAYKRLNSQQKQQFTERYEQETGKSSLILMAGMLSTGKPQQNGLRIQPQNPFAKLAQAEQEKKEAPPAAASAKPVMGPTLPSKPVDPKVPGWLTDSKDFVKWVDTILVTGQGGMIEGFRQAEGSIAAASLAKTGKFFETTGAGFTIAGEVLDIYEVSNTAFQMNAKPQKLRQAIVCLTVKTELVTGAAALGGFLGGFGGPAAPITVPGGAIILSVAVDKGVDLAINRIEWCKL